MSTVQIPADIIAGAQSSAKKWLVPASFSLAQYGDESAWGKEVSGKFNYGGYTAKVKDAVFPFNPGTPLEPATLCPTSEIYQGKRVRCKRWFRDFTSVADYFDHHASLIATAPIYAPAMKALDGTATGLVKFVALVSVHYATEQDYAHILMNIINSMSLTKYDVA